MPRGTLIALVGGAVLLAMWPAGAIGSPAADAAAQSWSPEAGPPDTRLEQPVSVKAREITVGALLGQLSEQCAVALQAGPELQEYRVTAFLGGQPLNAAMAALAGVFDAEWQCHQDPAQGSFSYFLREGEARRQPVEVQLDQLWEQDARREAARLRPFRERKFTRYREALALPAAALLDRYEKTDPWLCWHLLSPVDRPMVEQATRLEPPYLEQLFAAGEVVRPLRAFPAAFRQHLALWAKGAWGPTGFWRPAPDPDALPRFADPVEAWDHSTVRFAWGPDGLQFSLLLPDGNIFQTTPMGMEGVGPYAARLGLADFGYREATLEYVAAAREEMKRWSPPPEDVEAKQEEEQRQASGPSEPLPGDARRQGALVLASHEWPLGVADALEEAARQREVGVIALYLPPEQCLLPRLGADSGETTLGEMLRAVSTRMGPAWFWAFEGDVLVGGQPTYWVPKVSVLRDEVVAEWRVKFAPGEVVDLEEFASLLGRLNEAQTARLYQRVPVPPYLPPQGLHLYGLLDAKQRQALRARRALPAASLGEEQRLAIWRLGKASRPWVGLQDVKQAVLRVVSRPASTGGAAISLIVDYHFPDAPHDRDIAFSCPLAVQLPERPFRPRRPGAPMAPLGQEERPPAP